MLLSYLIFKLTLFATVFSFCLVHCVFCCCMYYAGLWSKSGRLASRVKNSEQNMAATIVGLLTSRAHMIFKNVSSDSSYGDLCDSCHVNQSACLIFLVSKGPNWIPVFLGRNPRSGTCWASSLILS
ncbi:hypothetical protein R6Q57_022676 [Mikania cordata]